MTPPLLVFDLDGTLAETAGDLVASLNFILAREQLAPVSLADARPMVGMGARSLIRQGFEAGGKSLAADRLEALFVDFLAHYETHIAVHTQLFPGVVAALDRFQEQGWRFAVCTNKAAHPSVKLLEALGVRQRFAAICGQDTFVWSKPDGRALLATIGKAGGEPANALMVGDSRTDIDAARNAGIPVIAVDFGYTDTPVRELNPDLTISHFDELGAAVRRLRPGA